MNKKILVLVISAAFLTSCRSQSERLEPKINYFLQDNYVRKLPSAFPPLSPLEMGEAWAKEYKIGVAFAEKMELYQALTAFKRAQILLPPEEKARSLEIDYHILLSYYFGAKYDEVIYVFENSQLKYTNHDFPAFQDLLIVMYDSYEKVGQVQKAEGVFQLIQYYYPETEKKLEVSTAMLEGDISHLRELSQKMPDDMALKKVLTQYDDVKKSPGKAKTFNALLPGAGYLYLGQRQSAFTAFLLNSLFIAAAYQFFHRGYTAAGVIFTSFEAGWYFGGIYGAGQEANLYNERMYEKVASPVMNQERLFPIMMLHYAF